MKCELCHKAEATEAIVCQGNEDDELYVCAACAKAERAKRQQKRQRTRKMPGLPPGVSMSITEITRSPEGDVESTELAGDPPPFIGALLDAFKGVANSLGAEAEKRRGKKKNRRLTELPASRAPASFRVRGYFHLEGLHLAGWLEAVRRGVCALGMELEGMTVDGVANAGHAYRLMYEGSAERAKRVAEAILEQERNARARLEADLSRVFADAVCRALALLKNCRLLSDGEFFDLLSPLLLAARAKLVDGIKTAEIERLMNGRDLSSSEDILTQEERDRRDAERADEINKMFEEVMIDDVL